MDKQESKFNDIIPKPFFAEASGGDCKLKDAVSITSKQVLSEIASGLGDHFTKHNATVLLITDIYPGDSISSSESPFINIYIDRNGASLGNEGYKLIITSKGIELIAYTPEGAFRGVQTLKQLITYDKENNLWSVPCGVIRDFPRFEWRGAMLDVARHFFTVDEVKKYINQASLYKINRFHIHLSDDQGWRIQINKWPKLTETGAASSVNNEKGGFYTKEDYTEIVNYAAARYITVIPEIDMPGHTNAALSSYVELNCDDSLRQPYTGVKVGFSSLCVKKEITYKFVEDVLKEISELTPGPYLHIGGDEASSTDSAEYVYFINRVQDITDSLGKQMIGWEEIAQANLNRTSIMQVWRKEHIPRKGSKVILSPASLIYIDMKYDSSSRVGHDWAGYITLQKSYDWHPEEYMTEIPELDILGVEAPLWSETIKTSEDIEYLAFPRLISAAEIGWSTRQNRNWEDFHKRLSRHGAYMKQNDILYYEQGIR